MTYPSSAHIQIVVSLDSHEVHSSNKSICTYINIHKKKNYIPQIFGRVIENTYASLADQNVPLELV